MVWDCGKPSENIGKSFAQDPALLWGMRGRSKFGRICGVKDQALKDAFPNLFRLAINKNQWVFDA